MRAFGPYRGAWHGLQVHCRLAVSVRAGCEKEKCKILLSEACSNAWVAELDGPGLYIGLERRDLLVSFQACLEILQLLTLLLLNVDGDLAATMKEAGNGLEVLG